ncbi:MAG: PIG-L family deacetylase [Chryseolinea sp.]
MRKVSLILTLSICFINAMAQQPLRIMMIFAHPDEGEVYTGGTAALYTQLGHQVKFMSLTNGDAGHWEEKPEVLAKRRYQEAMNAKKVLNLADYEVLDYHDQGLKNTKESRAKVIKSIQAFNPDVVFTYYPAAGGHTDNMTAGYIVRDAVRDLKMDKLPLFLYVRDFHTSTFTYIPHFAFSIDKVWETKLQACGSHQTQVAEAIPHGMGILDEVRKDPAKQKQLIDDNTYAFSKVFPTYRYALEKWYGKDDASKIRYAEGFEVAEFGRQIREEEIFELLPMLPRSYAVSGTKNWTNTGIEIKEGEQFEVTAEGTIVWNKDGRQRCTADGAVPYTRWGNKPVLGAPTGSLIARIGEDSKDSFFVGADRKIIASKSGKLYLGINDDNTGDNDGEFRAWVKKISGN